VRTLQMSVCAVGKVPSIVSLRNILVWRRTLLSPDASTAASAANSGGVVAASSRARAVTTLAATATARSGIERAYYTALRGGGGSGVRGGSPVWRQWISVGVITTAALAASASTMAAAAAAASPAAAVARAPALPDAPFPDAQRVLDFWYGASSPWLLLGRSTLHTPTHIHTPPTVRALLLQAPRTQRPT